MTVAMIVRIKKRYVEKCGLVAYHAEQDVLGIRMGDDVGTLAQIVDHQRCKYEVPGPDDRLAPQVPHVGIERLAAGGTEDYLGEDEEACQAVFVQEPGRVPGAQRFENNGVIND